MEKPRILTIDDDPDFNRLLQLVLTKIKVDFKITESCDEFLHEIKAYKPNLCIIDINLDQGQGAGYQLLKAIRKTSSDIYLLVLSRRSSKDDILTALENGANDFLSKPLDDLMLQAKIQKKLKLATNIRGAVYKKVPDTNAKSTCILDATLHKVSEKGIAISSRHLLCQGTSLRLPNLSEMIPTIDQEIVTVSVESTQYDSNAKIYYSDLTFDKYDDALIEQIRKWLVEMC